MTNPKSKFISSLGYLIITLFVAFLCCSRPEAKVGVGTHKDEVVRSLGRPSNWISVPVTPSGPSGRINVATVFSVESILSQQMPANEIWIFEYSRANGSKYCLHLSDGKVTDVVEGAALKPEGESSLAAAIPQGIIEITGVLVDKNGAPVAETIILAYPLDPAGKPIFLSVQKPAQKPGMVTIETWNPQDKTKPDGGFILQMPLVSRIAEKDIREVGLSLERPAGGWGAVTVDDDRVRDPGEGGGEGLSDRRNGTETAGAGRKSPAGEAGCVHLQSGRGQDRLGLSTPR